MICKRSRPVPVLHERKTRIALMTRPAGKTAARLPDPGGRPHPARESGSPRRILRASRASVAAETIRRRAASRPLRPASIACRNR